jgi:MFS transporter, Spinster family, sphingosine-1-phosphate transporter
MNANANAGGTETTVHIFVSYAREDRRWLDPEYRYNLVPFLAESLRRYNVAFWYDTELKPGDEFKRHIESQIDQARIALLVVSQNFLNSLFIEQNEMPRIGERAQAGHMIVVPVLVEPCDWSDYPFLADRQMVPSSPLIDYTESDPKWAKVKFQILDGLKAQLKRIREAPLHAVAEIRKPEAAEPATKPQPAEAEVRKPEKPEPAALEAQKPGPAPVQKAKLSPPPDVFISYSLRNRETADHVCAMLEAEALRCWIAPRDVAPGTEWDLGVLDALKQSPVMVLLFTAESNASPRIRREIEFAIHHGLAIVPVRFGDVEPAPEVDYFLGNIRWFDAVTPPLESDLKRLAQRIKGLLARTSTASVVPAAKGSEKPPVEAKRSEPAGPPRPEPRMAESAPAVATSTEAAATEAPEADHAAVTAVPATLPQAAASRANFARRTLLLLLALSLFNYAVRSLQIAALQRAVYEFTFASASVAPFLRGLFVIYAGVALISGWLGDRFRRKPMIVAAAIMLSLGTLASGWAHDFQSLLLSQALVSAGEAAFDVFALATLADLYSERERSLALSIFCVAIPIGSSIGAFVNAVTGGVLEFSGVLQFCSLAGLLLTALYWWLGREPERGSCDIIPPSRPRTTFSGLFANPAFLFATFGLAFLNFALLALSSYGVFYLSRFRDFSIVEVGRVVGASTIIGGFSGIIAGGWLAQRRLRTSDRALYMLSFLSVAIAVPFFASFCFGPTSLSTPSLFGAEFFLLLPTGPLYAAAVNSVSAPIRSRAIAIFLALARCLSGVLAPSLIATIAEHDGISTGIGSMTIFLVLSCVALIIGARFAPPLHNGLGSGEQQA